MIPFSYVVEDFEIIHHFHSRDHQHEFSCAQKGFLLKDAVVSCRRDVVEHLGLIRNELQKFV